MNVTYVDTNVLVYAFGDPSHPRRKGARSALEQAADEGPLITSTLTIDEFLWARRRESCERTAIEDTRILLRMPVLQLLAVEPAYAHKAIDHIETLGLHPRDAFHLAIMDAKGSKRLLSDDPDFDRIPGVERIVP